MREPAFSYIDAMCFIDAQLGPPGAPSAALALSSAALLGAEDDVAFPVQQNNARLGPL